MAVKLKICCRKSAILPGGVRRLDCQTSVVLGLIQLQVTENQNQDFWKKEFVGLHTEGGSSKSIGFVIVNASLVAQTVKDLLAVQETRIQSLGQEDPLEKGKATHFSVLAWRILCTEEPGGLQSMG